MKTTMHKMPQVLALAVLVALCGCERGPTLSEIEERERSSRLYTNAVDDLQAGRMDAAIRGFERVVLQEPKSYSAHFQLATLLQDIKKDYIGAIAHYKAYLDLRPASDKATVAQDRMKICDALLSAEYVRKAGGSATDKLATDNEKLVAARNELTARVKQLEGQLAAAQKQVATLTEESEMRKRLLMKLGAETEGSSVNTGNVSAKEALAELRAIEAEEKRKSMRPTDAELLDDEPAAPMPSDRIASSEDAKKLIAQVEADERKDAQNPFAKKIEGKTPRPTGFSFGTTPKAKKLPGARPETYVVQEGDTLFRISTRFYGSSGMWRKIRDANRGVIDMDGRVRAGLEIKLP